MKTPACSLAPSAEELKNLSAVALGESRADLVLVGGDVVDVYSGEILNGYAVAIKGERIAFVGPDAGHTIGPETEVIDLSGKSLAPGFIDAHTHLIYYYSPPEFLRYAMRDGTTCIVTETMEIAFPLGYRGIRAYLKAIRDQPIKIFATAPPLVSAVPSSSPLLKLGELEKLFREEDVLGLGEGYWQEVLRNEGFLELFVKTKRSGRRIEGHSAGAKGRKLAAYLACGVSSCHEPIDAAEVLERLRQGIHVMIREGSIRRELEATAPVKDAGVDLRRLILVTDGLEPGDATEGHLGPVVRKAVALGFDPIQAIQMVTLNPAEHFGLDEFIGGIAPGRFADIAVFPDLVEFKAEMVLSNGRVIVREGEPVVQPRKHPFPGWTRRSIHLSPLKPEDFIVPACSPRVRVRAIQMVTQLVTRKVEVEIEAADGHIKSDISRDILKVAAIERGKRPGRKFIGLVKGFGLKRGAFGSTFAWDCSDVIVLGVDERDMARAVNRIIELGGGVVLCADGEVLSEVPLPIGGVISARPMEDLAAGFAEIQRRASELGIPFPNAHLALITLTTPAIPFFRISSSGLIDIKENKLLGLEVTE
ncbi:MAG: adenine deaminase C-terminal domain-containing protein [Candidatus Bipolaricaulia bacterium]